MDLSTLVGAAGLVVGLVLLWTRKKPLEVSSFQATLLSIIDVVGFIIAIVTLGWLGVGIFISVSLTAILAWSAVRAMKKQSILVNAAVQGSDISIEEANTLWDWMREEKSFAAVAPIKRAEMIRALASRARGPAEIRAMSVPIAQLSTIFECDPEWLSPRFDRLLRLYGNEADDAMEVADTLTRGTQLAAASFKEMVEAMLAVGDGG
jgi:hypothetical protein